MNTKRRRIDRLERLGIHAPCKDCGGTGESVDFSKYETDAQLALAQVLTCRTCGRWKTTLEHAFQRLREGLDQGEISEDAEAPPLSGPRVLLPPERADAGGDLGRSGAAAGELI